MEDRAYAYGDTDPIAAFATPLAESALAVIRTSGKGAVELAASVFSRTAALLKAPGNTVVHGWILGAGNEPLDEVLVTVYRAFRSYTGEDGADISCHGGISAARAVMDTLKRAGFRNSLPGEFTFRAFRNGKLDLTRAESVMELVSARTGRGREQAIRRLSGVLETELLGIKTLLIQSLGGTEVYLDYSEDDGVEMADSGDAAGLLPDRPLVEEALGRLKKLAAGYERERLYNEGALAVIAGRPNAGKSSLFNLLLQEDRSIVTDIPGTTRDWIESWINIEDIPVRLADTAGLHDSPDPVELLGMERSRELMKAADLILYVIDGKEGLRPEDRAFLEGRRMAPVLALWNKADMVPVPALSAGEAALPGTGRLLAVSAKTGEGIPVLCREIALTLEKNRGAAGPGDTEAAIGTERQKELIDRAAAALEETLVLADRREPLDLIAPLLREGVNSLGEITGEVSTAGILEAMFSRFCVGK
jgi:tRNA modification GTPase